MLLERLNALLRDSDSLLSRERDGRRRIYLYDMGDWWVSFERSACRLCGLFPGCDTTVLRLYDRPYPLVMASVSDRSLRAYARRHPLQRVSTGCLSLPCGELSPARYASWRRQILFDGEEPAG